MPTRELADIVSRAQGLLSKTDAGARPVRLLGVSVHNLCENIQVPVDDDRLPLFDREGQGE